jgi:hypothetical protein
MAQLPLSEWWPLVSGRGTVEEKRAADQDQSQRTANAGGTKALGLKYKLD